MNQGALADIDELDAAGRHTEAIAALARATGAGNIDAMAALGRRLLVGDRGPCLPADGARLLLDAAQRGHPDAQGRAAALLGGGIGTPQSWPAALAMLGAAAEGGHHGARAQLTALGGAGDPGGHWKRLAANFDLTQWLARPAAQTLRQDPQILVFGQLLPEAVCAWLIEQSRGRLVRARVYDPIDKRETTSEMRTNTTATFGVAEVGLLHFLVQARIASGCGIPLTHFEAPAVLHYDVGEQITPHFDFIDPRAPDYAQQISVQGQRIYTCLIYLNDAYEGGETAFPELGIEHRGSLREGLLFTNIDARDNPDLRMLHAGKPPTRGEKWIFSQFIRRRPVR